MSFYLNNVLRRMVCINQTLSFIIQLGDGGLFGLKTLADKVLLGWDPLRSGFIHLLLLILMGSVYCIPHTASDGQGSPNLRHSSHS